MLVAFDLKQIKKIDEKYMINHLQHTLYQIAILYLDEKSQVDTCT